MKLLALIWSSSAQAATLPIAGTDVADSWNSLYWFLIGMSVFFFVGIVSAMIYFVIAYHHGNGKRPTYITDHHALELTWTIVPTILVMGLFVWGWDVYYDMTHAPSDAMEIRVVAKQWLWQFLYKDGQSTVNDLYVPLNKPVKLIMASDDVLHSVFIPNFRVKSDVVPGMYTSIWFDAKVPGIHQMFCTQYCGTSHSGMLGRVIVLEPELWKKWLAGEKIDVDSLPADPTYPGFRANKLGEGLPGTASTSGGGATTSLAAKGKITAQGKGCVACHSADGTKIVGPTWKGLFGSKQKLAAGGEATADENFIRHCIENPTDKVIAGFPAGQMPVYKGLVNEEEMAQLVEYIKSLK